MSENKVTFDEAIGLLKNAHVVVIYPPNDAPTLATLVDWKDENNKESGFEVWAEGFDDIYIYPPKESADKTIGTFSEGYLRINGKIPLGLFTRMP